LETYMLAEVINHPSNPVNTNVLRGLGVARQIAVGAASAEQVLSDDCKVISLKAIGTAMHIRTGVGVQTAVGTDHYVAEGERIDLAVLPGSRVAAIAASGTGTLYISELV
jgi:hypothetical protein